MGEQQMYALVRRRFLYEPESGLLTYREATCRKGVGERAGTPKPYGYRHVIINGKEYLEHRLIWLWVHGHWPRVFLDHINRVRDDNRISNLREVTHMENMQNRTPPPNRLGVGVRLVGKRFSAYATDKRGQTRKQVHLGTFDTKDQAVAARRAHDFQRGAA